MQGCFLFVNLSRLVEARQGLSSRLEGLDSQADCGRAK